MAELVEEYLMLKRAIDRPSEATGSHNSILNKSLDLIIRFIEDSFETNSFENRVILKEIVNIYFIYSNEIKKNKGINRIDNNSIYGYIKNKCSDNEISLQLVKVVTLLKQPSLLINEMDNLISETFIFFFLNVLVEDIKDFTFATNFVDFICRLHLDRNIFIRDLRDDLKSKERKERYHTFLYKFIDFIRNYIFKSLEISLEIVKADIKNISSENKILLAKNMHNCFCLIKCFSRITPLDSTFRGYERLFAESILGTLDIYNLNSYIFTNTNFEIQFKSLMGNFFVTFTPFYYVLSNILKYYYSRSAISLMNIFDAGFIGILFNNERSINNHIIDLTFRENLDSKFNLLRRKFCPYSGKDCQLMESYELDLGYF